MSVAINGTEKVFGKSFSQKEAPRFQGETLIPFPGKAVLRDIKQPSSNLTAGHIEKPTFYMGIPNGSLYIIGIFSHVRDAKAPVTRGALHTEGNRNEETIDNLFQW